MPWMIQEAVRWAVELHYGQDRDGDDPMPYIFHPISVANRLRSACKVTDQDQLAAAILHDVVEETEATIEDVRIRFGPGVARLVEELTRREPSAEEAAGLSKKKMWELRTKLLLEDISRMSPEAQRIKLCDRIDNLLEARETRTKAKYERYLAQTRLVLKVIPRRVQPALWDQIQAIVEGSQPKGT